MSVETEDKAKTLLLLPSFAPFVCRKEEEESALVFEMKGNALVSAPLSEPEDVFNWNGVDYTVYRRESEYVVEMVWQGKTHRMRSSADWKRVETDLSLVEKSESQFLNNFLMIALGMSSAPLRTVKMHASVTEFQGKALLFLGRSGTGKSTHSRLWREFISGCSLLNDDEPLVRICADGVVRVFGTPWSGKTPCYKNRSAEVAAFVHLHQSPENKLSKLKGTAALSSMLQSASLMRCDSHNREQVLDTLVEVLGQVPVYRLDCRPDYEAVSLTRSLLP